MEIRKALTSEEVEAAIDLSSKSFPISYFDARSLRDAMRSYLPQDFIPERFIIGIDNGKIIAVYRSYPRKISIAGIEVKILGLADYCIDKFHKNNKMLGVTFHKECSRILKQSNYPFGMGSARRTMSNYYYALGYISNDAYCKCKIEKLKVHYDSSLKEIKFVEVFNEDHIDAYDLLRSNSFASEWSMVLRTKDYWRWIGYQAKHLREYRFIEMIEGTKLVGFFVVSDNNCLDYGLDDSEFERYSKAMVIFLSKIVPIDKLTFNISPRNRLFRSLGLSNLSYSMRFVPDEGIVALGLNREKLLNIFCKVTTKMRIQLQLNHDDFVLGNNLSFKWKNNQFFNTFRTETMTRKDENILLNCLFQGTYGPLCILHYNGPFIIPPTFFRINDLDAM
jgi:hypothetical protein